jgi:hypothetical protein
MTCSGCASEVKFQWCYIQFEHTLLNPGILASVYIGGLRNHSFHFKFQQTLLLSILEKAYWETLLINALKIKDVHHLVSYVADEQKIFMMKD